MQIVPAFAYLMPVVLLFSIGYAAAVVSTIIYAIPPAVRITALGIRGVATNTVEAAASMGATRRQMLAQGAAPARAADAAARRQPDDPVRALDGRDRGPDRRRRPRRRRHERPLHEPGARDPRRHRDRDHGDGARPRDRGDRRRAPTRPSGISTRPARARLRLQTLGVVVVSAVVGRRREALRRRGDLPRHVRRRRAGRRRSRSGCSAQIQSVLDYVQNPESWVFRITEPTGNCILTHAAAADPELPHRGAVVHDRRRADADRARHLAACAGADDASRCSS